MNSAPIRAVLARVLLTGSLALFAAGLPVLAAADQHKDIGRKFPAPGNMSCDEAARAAAPWIRWAEQSRDQCQATSSNRNDYASCMQRVRTQLKSMEREYASVYRSQMRTIKPDHPIMTSLIERVKQNAQAASQVIENADASRSNQTPMQLACRGSN